MKALNIILKSFDGHPTDKDIAERAFRGIALGSCLSISNTEAMLPTLDAKEHLWIPAKKQREGDYGHVDWTAIEPLDEDLIERMRPCEAVFVKMVERYARQRDIPYDERRRQYLDHLRYWNHMLGEKKIDLVLMNHMPHQCYDWVLYRLCKLRGIKTLYIERCHAVDSMYMVEDIEESATEFRDALEKAKREHADPGTQVPLSPQYEEYFRMYTRETVVQPGMFWRKPHFHKKSFLGKWAGVGMRMLVRKPLSLVKSLVSPEFWARKLRQHRTFAFYDRHVMEPDLRARYVYVALHLQPEASTVPMAGAYCDQDLIVELLAACLPKDVLLYVKEHPTQEELCRSERFYESMLRHPNVRFLPRDADSVALVSSSLAVATATGTVGFEGLFREKPILLFGHRFYQYATGMYPIHTREDCEKAVAAVMAGNKPTLRDGRIMLKALQDTATPYVDGLENGYGHRTPEEKARLNGEKIARCVEAQLQAAAA